MLKTIVLGITGSVSAVNSFNIARELKRRGFKVVAVLSDDAKKFVTPELMKFACDEVLEEFDESYHVRFLGYGGEADLLLIAPATANTISKIAHGIADTNVTLVALTALGSGKPVLVAPAMHLAMYEAIKDNLEILRSKGVEEIKPKFEGLKAKLAEVERIVLHVERALSSDEFKGKRVVVTSGPTFEFIDPIRFISNKSSGRMGNELALEFWRRKAEVVLISSKPIEIDPPNFKVVKVVSVKDMLDAVLKEIENCDLFVCASAPSDFVVDRVDSKIKTTEELVLKLKQAPKIIKEVRKVYDGPIIGFKAETGLSDEELIEVAKRKMEEDKLEMVVANDVKERGMGTVDTRVVIVTPKRVEWVKGLKRDVAKRIVNAYVEDYL
ncbi:bifunctional phosphopantothenoylcysteine decarboxylase/phosphopantothenate--cysteine ligase CoaBC [Archaeoglobus profundus]|uniref:Coenzyme A biosynthesis bifunctional protein CoaBC n=1 Tax=Archaeoglobus profundus (strain DSM 5631 / JCM 9629 / NBRC 100127 / Av18) TaxID=572546 RepID=D2RGS0_ARCPA|nr:bifunctional phosphopantothenoylcysteine decarboxylase/phosphopantothenate--cysteine ligase CoaBC [Archaeoglobus profundus]ADB57495.1 phosphopantothenoylcysteine decarboxylase/phosphopantothenate/cysteine ligase [Archaeoglobus profundus DSM 5631]